MNGLGVAEAEVVTEGNSNIVISVPGDNGDQARQLGADRPAAVPPGHPGPVPATPAASSSATPSGARLRPAAATGSGTARVRRGHRRRRTAARRRQPAAAPPRHGAGTRRRPHPAARSPTRAPTPERARRSPRSRRRPTLRHADLRQGVATGTVDRPEDYVASLQRGRHGEVPARPGGHRGHRRSPNATAGTAPTTGAWVVKLDFNSQGLDAVGDLHRRQRRQAGRASPSTAGSSPRRRSTGAITGGKTEITGSFTQTTATELANQLKYGALPLSFTQATAQSISTELGAEQLQAGLIAGAIGIALVFIYALLYYRLLGLVMIASLGALGRASSTPAWCCWAGRSASP